MMMLLTSRFVGQMEAHSARVYPEEGCGILLGSSNATEKVIGDVVEIKNSSDQERKRRFVITPEDYLNAENSARARGMEVLGFYHSHPDHPARPSQFDLEHAFPSWSYIIIGVNRGKPDVMTSWILREDRSQFDEETLHVSDKD